ncbi:ribosomal RNA-processing protein 7-domain-containing protein [Obelidium mucronatum]|nr:ribosomal RNA-processing protein 7-domain-containing protein [Obelidium mucronatum]
MSKDKLATFSGFHVLPVTLPGGVQHSILFKPHDSAGASAEHPAAHTLFLCNLPVDATRAHVLRLFRRCGAVARVDLSARRHTAHVVFAGDDALLRCAEMRRRKRVWGADAAPDDADAAAAAPQPVGLEKWVAAFVALHPPLAELQAAADSYMKQYDQMQAERQRELARRRAEPDEDGFILVGAHKQVKKAEDEAAAAAAGEKKQKKKLERVDFYRFQMRESKRNQLVELRNKFEEDKKRIEKLKATRKFKPY